MAQGADHATAHAAHEKSAGANMPPLMPDPMTTDVARVLPTIIPAIR